MKNLLQDGCIAVVPAPAAVASGDFVVVGSLFGVAQVDAAITVDVPIVREGVFTLPKTTGTAWTKGDILYWNTGTGKFTKSAAGNVAYGVAFADAASGDATGAVSIEAVVPESAINAVAGVGAAYKIARGVHTQVAASDTVVTGLATVISAVAGFKVGPTVKQLFCNANVGDQAGTPAAGSILIKTFKPTAVNDVTPTAATDFSENLDIEWIAVGT